MPKEVNILGVIYKVEEVECVDKYVLCFGNIDYMNSVIRIDKTLSQDKKNQTLMHEILHGIFEGLGYQDLSNDEEKVQSIATALHSVFKENTIFS